MAKKESKRGGARPGAGRPKKPGAKTAVFSVAVSAEDLELLRATHAKEWAREVLVKSARRRQ